MVDTKVENKDASSEKKPRWRRKKSSNSNSTPDSGGNEKFEGASDEMKGNVFSIGRDQADVYATTMKALVIVVGVKYSAVVSAAVRELKVRPAKLKIPEYPDLQ